MSEGYKVLPIGSVVFKTLAWIGVLLGLISALIIFIGAATPETPRWMSLVTIVAGVVYFFIFMTISEGIRLLLEINDKIK